MSIIALVIFFILFPFLYKFILKPYYENRNKKLKSNEKYTNEEYGKILKAKFSQSEKAIFNSLIIIPIIGFLLFGFILIYLVSYIQGNYLLDPNVLYINTPISTIIILFVIGLILGVFLFNIYMNIVGYFSPRFNIYVTKNRSQLIELREIEDKNKKIKDIIHSGKGILVFFLISLPLILLTLFNYHYVTTTGIVVNKFFSLSESKYNWSEINKVKILVDVGYSDGKKQFTFSYNVITKDNNLVNLWGRDLEGLYSVNKLIISKNIHIDRPEINQEIISFVNHAFKNSEKLILNILGVNKK